MLVIHGQIVGLPRGGVSLLTGLFKIGPFFGGDLLVSKKAVQVASVFV